MIGGNIIYEWSWRQALAGYGWIVGLKGYYTVKEIFPTNGKIGKAGGIVGSYFGFGGKIQ